MTHIYMTEMPVGQEGSGAGVGDSSTRDAARPLRKLQNRAQTLIHSVLQPRRQHPGLISQETAVHSQELRNVDDRVAGQARQACPQHHVARGIRQICVGRDDRHDYGLNAASIEGIRLDHKHRTPVTRLGSARFGEVCPPDFSSPDFVHAYQDSRSRDAI